ncbi:MAG: 50S ribosomal protein L31 [Pseudomonadota bacterium]
MKAEGHPDYHFVTIVQTDGTEFQARTTWGKQGDVMRLDVDSLSHPAWRGGEVQIVQKEKIKKFESKYGNFMGTKSSDDEQKSA